MRSGSRDDHGCIPEEVGAFRGLRGRPDYGELDSLNLLDHIDGGLVLPPLDPKKSPEQPWLP